MTPSDSKTEGVARVYADAMLELAEAGGQADSLLDELAGFTQAMDADPAFDRFLTSADVDFAKRAAVLEKTLRGRASELLVNALQVINRKGRMDIIRAIVEAYRLGHEVLRAKVDVHVTSAVPLTDELRRALVQTASRYAGREAQLVETVDEDILGGLSVRIGDTKLDTSLATHLKRIRSQLHERGERAIHGDAEYAFVEGSAL